jgi:hypothetical protein
MTMRAAPRLPGLIALSAFFVFGATMSGLSFLALSFPGNALDSIWQLNPAAHEGFLRIGGWAIVLMASVSAACATAAAGLYLRTQWGYWTALSILAVNMTGDTANALMTGDLRTLIGVPVAGLLIAYLLSAKVRRQFAGTVSADR